MEINPIAEAPSVAAIGTVKPARTEKADFGSVLKEELNKVNDMQIKADEASRQLVTGEAKDIHSVLLAAEEARLALEVTVQIRNKLIESYQEINRIQL
ncbi:flagellar hook-basal body complex protein FliE [Eubacteriales bacterium mix99]|jgi:flagellar hook-basal body complex protein FliE|nr:flagellar hook-basal body complex protein FliE [Clostridiales bacterium]